MASPRPDRRWLVAIPIVLSAVLLYFALRGIEWRRVGEIIASARLPILPLGLLTAVAGHFLRALRWRVLLTANQPVSMGTVFWSNSAGYLGNNFLPGRAGELVRTMMISSRSALTKSYVLTTALAERVSDLLFLIVASSLALSGVPGKPAWLTGAAHTMTGVGLAAACALAIVPKTRRLVTWMIQKLPVSTLLRAKLLQIAEQIQLGAGVLHRPSRLLPFLALTVVIWTTDVLGAMLLAYVLHLYMSFTTGLLLITALGLSSAIPATPGYVGVFQYVAVTVLVPFGFAKSDALAYILMLQVMSYVVVIVLGLTALAKLNLSLSFFKRVQAE